MNINSRKTETVAKVEKWRAELCLYLLYTDTQGLEAKQHVEKKCPFSTHLGTMLWWTNLKAPDPCCWLAGLEHLC